MKKKTWFLSLLLLFSLALTGCGLVAGADEEPLEPLDAATWPTSVPPTAAASPTPFPHADWAPTATPQVVLAQPTAVVTKESLAGQSTSDDALVTNNPAQVTPNQGQITPATATPSAQPELPAVTSGLITISAVNVRQGPGANYAKLGTLSLGHTVDVFATNPRQDWVLVQSGQLAGWISLSYLDLSDSDKVLPVVRSGSPEQVKASGNIAPLVMETGGKSEAISDSAAVAPQQEQSDEIALSPVTTAKISVDKTEIRPGPDASFAPIDELTDRQEELTVLGLDKSRQWALVQPQHSRLGWAAVANLQFDGSLDAAPTVYTAWVISNAVEVRSGPGIFHDQTGQLAINSLVRVLGLDDSGSWAVIQPIPGGSLGWSPIQFLENVGQPWANIPPAPDLPAPVQAAATAEPFTPARPLSESKIVFQRSSGGDIMVINPDGSGLRRLTSGIDPVLSPDGQRVAFTRWEDTQNGALGSLWVINVDGSGERAILGDIHQPKAPTWSPDGTQIAISMQHGGRVQEERKCSSEPPPRGAYDVDADRDDEGDMEFCYTLPPHPYYGLRGVDVATGEFEDLPNDLFSLSPAWDPADPGRLVFDGERGLMRLDLEGGTGWALTDNANDHSPVFSPDGRYLVVTTGKEGSGAGYNLYRLNADGSGRVQLTQTPLWVTSQPDEAKAWNNVAPAWSPDASQIAFLTDRTGRWEIWVMNADGSNPQPMFSDEINTQLQLTYNFVDERMLSWR